jgi:hypothetical protein
MEKAQADGADESGNSINANKRMKSTSAVSSIRIIANRRESVKEA